MSTRCQIGFYENKNDRIDSPHTLLYRHSDGYPGNKKEYGTLTDLIPFLNHFISQRGYDIEYIGARCLCYLIHEHTQDLPSQNEKVSKFGGYLSYGICKPEDFHGDIEFYYAVFPDEVRIYEPSSVNPIHWGVIEIITLETNSKQGRA